jgi:hypothetical protein
MRMAGAKLSTSDLARERTEPPKWENVPRCFIYLGGERPFQTQLEKYGKTRDPKKVMISRPVREGFGISPQTDFY